MPKKAKDTSDDSSSDSSDDSNSSSPSPARKSRSPTKKKSSKISSSKHHSRKSRKSYKHRDDKKKKRRRSSSSSAGSDSRSKSPSPRSASRGHKNKRKSSRTKSREREKERDLKKKTQAPPPEKKPVAPAKTEEEILRDKERKKQIRLAKVRAIKYDKEEEVAGRESPKAGPAPQEKMEEVEERSPPRDVGLMDELESDNDEEKSTKEQQTPALKGQTAEMEEEIDPLDAFMNEIDQVAKKQVQESINQSIEANGYSLAEPKIDQSRVITAEELEKLFQQPPALPPPLHGAKVNNTTFQNKVFAEDEVYGKNGEEEDDDKEEEYRKIFLEAMKKKELNKMEEEVKEVKEDEKPKKKAIKFEKGEILDDDTQGDYMAFREDNDPETDFISRQKRQAEKKELKAAENAEADYEPFRKSFYIESREIGEMTQAEVDEYRKELGEIQVRGRDCPKPIKSWYQCGLSDAILDLITEKKKFANPFPIQCQAIPAIMSGRDVIGVAETGSGKTLAYVLPMLRHIKDQRPLVEGDGPVGLILAPTRELAWQIYIECRAFAKAIGMNVACVYGGAGVQGQIADLKRGAEIVVCTPGRMIDVLSTSNGKITNLRRVTFVVLDEADRMLDFGFEPQIGRILANVRPDRQTAMFSATFPRNVENLAKKVLTKPIEIIVGSRGKISSNIDQIIEVVDEESKFLRLLKILGEWSEQGSILIFVNKQTDADNLFKELLKFAYYPLVLHGGQDADDRENTISDFKKGVRTLMVATSVCARGLDIKSLVLVVNYQCPQHKEDYIHRIGRTGRAGNKGTAITFITPEEDQYAMDIITALKMSNIEPPQDLLDLANSYKEQVDKGERKHYSNRNLTGTGFKFDKNETEKAKETKRALKRQFGLELNMSDVDSDEDIITNKETKDDKDKEVDEAHIKKMLKDPNTRTAVTRAAEKAAKDAILAGSSSEEVLQAAHNAIKSILSQYRGSGLEQVVKLVTEIEEREDESNERFSANLEINDYPQTARHKVTGKDFLGSIQDLTNCTVSMRGTYFEPGKKIPPNQKKLRLHIVGESKHDVENAYREIRRVLEETAAYSMNTVSGQSGKFTL